MAGPRRERFVEAGIALTEDGKYLGIVLAENAIDPPLVERRGYLNHSINNQQPA